MAILKQIISTSVCFSLVSENPTYLSCPSQQFLLILWSKKIFSLFVHLLKFLLDFSVKSLSCNWPLKSQFSQQCLERDGIYQNTSLWQTIMKRSVGKRKYNSSNPSYNTDLLLVFVFFTLNATKKSIFKIQNSASCKTQSIMGQQQLSGTLKIHFEVAPSFSVLPFLLSLMKVLSFEALLATHCQCAICTSQRNSSSCDLTDHCRRHSET